MVIPCLCSFMFAVPNSPSAELVGAKPLHLLTQTVLLLKHPTGVFVAGANANLRQTKNVPEPFFIKNRVPAALVDIPSYWDPRRNLMVSALRVAFADSPSTNLRLCIEQKKNH